MQNTETTSEILQLALELSTPTINNQTQYIQKLHHYESLIEKSTNFKHELLMEIREEQIKQRSFEIINNLIKQNSQLQKKVTLLEEQLINKVKEFADIKKISIRCVAAEQQLRKTKSQNQNIQQVQETLLEVKREIAELINVEKKCFTKIDDPCIILNRQRDQLLALKKTVESRNQQFELSWKINKGLSQSLNKRQQLNNQTIRILTQLLSKPTNSNIIYEQKVRQLSSQQQQLLLNYQKSLLRFRNENNDQKNRIIQLENSSKQQSDKQLKYISTIEELQLKSVEQNSKITKLQQQMKQIIRMSQSIKKNNEIKSNNQKLMQELQSLRSVNDKNITILKQSNQQRSKLKLQNQKLSKQNTKLSKQILKLQKTNNELIKINQNQHQSIESLKTSSKQSSKNTQIISKLQKQINLLNETNLSLNNNSQKISNQNNILLIKIQQLNNKIRQHECLNNQSSIIRTSNLTANLSLQQNDQDIEQNLNQLNQIIYLMTFQY